MGRGGNRSTPPPLSPRTCFEAKPEAFPAVAVDTFNLDLAGFFELVDSLFEVVPQARHDGLSSDLAGHPSVFPAELSGDGLAGTLELVVSDNSAFDDIAASFVEGPRCFLGLGSAQECADH
jgi:hypothetical protein